MHPLCQSCFAKGEGPKILVFVRISWDFRNLDREAWFSRMQETHTRTNFLLGSMLLSQEEWDDVV
jgi:hypothetical protein